jgi:hypothetical protein
MKIEELNKLEEAEKIELEKYKKNPAKRKEEIKKKLVGLLKTQKGEALSALDFMYDICKTPQDEEILRDITHDDKLLKSEEIQTKTVMGVRYYYYQPKE